ncbi:sigma-54-dependent transcriptional regulator [Teredinibacter turnerae]|uniref:sigma-54-dependent transcriptional regulator n=1 Tax=Teredinibacter turnerae TaxID=2426 RepID=UPI00035D1D72|nr:sigma-54 dependent transcriptional regulator [Teredinibacter turnerae]
MLNEQTILLLDDDPQTRRDFQVIFEFLGEHVESASFLEVDSWLEQGDSAGMLILGACNSATHLTELQDKIQKAGFLAPIVLLGEPHPLESSSNNYLKSLIIDRLSAPVNYNILTNIIHRAQRYNEARRRDAGDAKRPVHLFRSLVGTSRQIQAVRAMMSQVADKDVTVLIEGESGTGKEVVARNLHYHSTRRDGPFVPVNCGAIPAELLESELFGHEKGAFTGAINARAGRFELAEGGTLFLDEIGDMPLHMQVKILRVLQERTFERVGGNRTFNTNVRIIAATHRNLEQMIEEGKFREDLYYRLNVFPIEMPSLRERAEDIPLLIQELISRLESEKRGSVRFNSAAVMSLCNHPWQGNVRELANLVERMAIMKPFGIVGLQDLPQKYRHGEVPEVESFEQPPEETRKPTVVAEGDIALLPESGIDLKEYIAGLEQSLIQQALDNTGGVVARAAEQLAIRRTTLVEKMRKYGLQRS